MRRRGWEKQPGMTLVEVLATLAITGVLLGGVLLAVSRARRQMAAAREQAAALIATDELLASWRSASKPAAPAPSHADTATPHAATPLDGHGTLSLADGRILTWNTRVIDGTEAERLQARVVRLTVQNDIAVVATIDLLVPKPEPRRTPEPIESGGRDAEQTAPTKPE